MSFLYEDFQEVHVFQESVIFVIKILFVLTCRTALKVLNLKQSFWNISIHFRLNWAAGQ